MPHFGTFPRRHLLGFGVGSLVSFSFPRLCMSGKEPTQDISGQTFLDSLQQLAAEIDIKYWNQQTYVTRVSALLSRLSQRQQYAAYQPGPSRGENDRLHVIPLAEQEMFEASLFILPAGFEFPVHDHPGTCAVTYGISGCVRITGYSEIMTQNDGSIVLSLDHQTMLTPGMVSTLTAERSNIHGLLANGSSQLIDVFTPPYNIETTKKTRTFKISSGSEAGKNVVAVPSMTR